MRKVELECTGILLDNSCSRSSSSMNFFDDSEFTEFEKELDELLCDSEQEDSENE